MSHPENSKNNQKSASGLPESFSALISLLYAVCYLVGARIIRYYRRCRRIVKLSCLHAKWAVRRFYFDIKEQRSAAAPSKGYWKREWKKAFSQTLDALHDWNKHRKQPDAGLCFGEFFRAFIPSLRKIAGSVNYILPVAGMIVLISTIHHFSTLTFGLRVQYNGEHIGYILSESDFSEAEAKVKERIVNEAYLPPEDSVPIYSLEVVEADQISDQSVLINNIIRASGNEIEEAAGLYVDDEFVGAVKDGDALLLSLKARKEGTYQPGMTQEDLEEQAQPEKPEEKDETPVQTPEEKPETESPVEEPEEQPAEPSESEITPSPAQTYTIQEGDSLWDIANEFDISVDELTQLNPEVSKTMLVGETLVVSQGSSSDTVSEPADPSEETEDLSTKPEETEQNDSSSSDSSDTQTQQTYTVQEGDTPWDIANEFGISVDELLQLNPSIADSMLIGDTLIIKAGTPSDSSAEQTTEESTEEPEQMEEDDTEQTEESTSSSETVPATQSPLPPITEEGVTLDSEVVSFVQDIRVEKGLYPVSSVESLDSLNAKLDTVVEGEQTYTIQEGDTPWDIANKFDIPTETLLNLNPEVSKNMLVGDVFIISQEQPFLQTKVVRTVTEEQEIQFTTEKEVDKNKDSSYQEVLQEGKNGLKEVTTEITYIDGYETERAVTAETTLVEPVNAKVVVGSLKSSSPYNFNGSGSNSTESNVGGYIWPVNGGSISCPIWGYYGHTGTDIQAPAGTTIWASKAGTVAYAGWSNGYGYNVLINHADGTKTRYAHCSSLAVYAGQQVSQGQVIGYVGRTGNATGNHCHFEIISGGSFLDARNYIGYSR